MRLALRVALALALVGAALGVGGASAGIKGNWFNVYPLVSDTAGGTALHADASLVNGWGLSAGPTTPWWTSNNGTNTSTLYSGAGIKSALTVSVPGGPTGTVFNANASDFVVSRGRQERAARFLFATQDGKILGWSPTVNGTAAVVAVDNSSKGALYDGLATISDRLYATDFHNARVDVFDSKFAPVTTRTVVDTQIPKGWAPFGIQALGGNVFVTYAKQDPAKRRTSPAAGSATSTNTRRTACTSRASPTAGARRRRSTRPGGSRWRRRGSASSRATYWVGNFGNGQDQRVPGPRAPGKWVFKGQRRVSTADHQDTGLWAIAFGNGGASGPANNLYFISGPNGEKAGLFGFVTVG